MALVKTAGMGKVGKNWVAHKATALSSQKLLAFSSPSNTVNAAWKTGRFLANPRPNEHTQTKKRRTA